MISEIIGDKHKMKRKHLSLFSGFHRRYTETVCNPDKVQSDKVPFQKAFWVVEDATPYRHHSRCNKR